MAKTETQILDKDSIPEGGRPSLLLALKGLWAKISPRQRLALLILGIALIFLAFYVKPQDSPMELLRPAVALLLVLGITVVGLNLLKGLGLFPARTAKEAKTPILLLEAKGLGNGQTLLVVEVLGEYLLVATGKNGTTLIARLKEPKLSPREDELE